MSISILAADNYREWQKEIRLTKVPCPPVLSCSSSARSFLFFSLIKGFLLIHRFRNSPYSFMRFLIIDGDTAKLKSFLMLFLVVCWFVLTLNISIRLSSASDVFCGLPDLGLSSIRLKTTNFIIFQTTVGDKQRYMLKIVSKKYPHK